VCQGQTNAVTLEDIAVLYPSIENVPVSFDDPLWRGGDPMILVALNDFTLANFGGSTNLEASSAFPRWSRSRAGAYIVNNHGSTPTRPTG
jgi:hypothetical protein